jgi:hypothetical protein
LGFLAQVVTRLELFVAAVLPALFVLGEFTFAALLRNTVENLVLLGQMQRIRGYYRGLVPEAGEFFDPPEADVLYQGGGGHHRAAGLAGAGAVHRGQHGGGDQQHPGWVYYRWLLRTGPISREYVDALVAMTLCGLT